MTAKELIDIITSMPIQPEDSVILCEHQDKLGAFSDVIDLDYAKAADGATRVIILISPKV